MSKLTDLGNDLYTGKRSIPFVPRLRTWLTISGVLVAIIVIGFFVRGFNLGIEFTGGSDFRVPGVANVESYDTRAEEAVNSASGANVSSATVVGGDTIRIQTERMPDQAARDVTASLAETFEVPADTVTSSVVGPSWGQSVSQQALQALAVFLLLVSIVLALYFRTWKMALTALVALAHDILVTVGIYSLFGFEITPASAIGFLTVLGYSIYDTVVVFDKVRENTNEAMITNRQTYSEAANLAVNQTLIRSINTTIVAVLPVAVVLAIGLSVIGPGTLLDLSLSLFVGITVGVYSSICIATPLLALLREREPEMKALRQRVHERREKLAAAGHPVDARGLPTNVGAPVAPTGTGEHDEAAAAAAATARPVGTATLQDPPERTSEPGSDVDASVPRTATGRPVHPSMLEPDTRASRRARKGRLGGRRRKRRADETDQADET